MAIGRPKSPESIPTVRVRSPRPVTVYGYDLAGNSAYTIDSSNRLSTNEYDAVGRQTKSFQGLLVDNGDPTAFQTTGSWSTLAEGYGGSSIYAAGSGTSTATAKWTFSNLVPNREYEIVITWTIDGVSTYATNAAFAVSYIDASGNSHTDTVYVDQTENLFMVDDTETEEENELLTVGNHAHLGKGWLTLDSYYTKGTQITVTLTNVANGRVAADAVVVYDISPNSQTTYDGIGNVATTTDALGNVTYYAYDVLNRPLTEFVQPTSIAAGDSAHKDPGYVERTGTWSGETYRYCTGAGTATATATWSTGNLKKGEVYEVLVAWQGDEANSANVPFSIYQGDASGDPSGDPLATFWIDQTKNPNAEGQYYFIDGRYYRSLGRYTLGTDDRPLVIQIANNTNDSLTVVADKVCVTKVTTASRTLYDDAGQTIASIDPLGRVSASEYDDLGRQVKSYNGVFLDDSEPGFAVSDITYYTKGFTNGGFGGTYWQVDAGDIATWSFNNLSFNANSPFDLYVYSPYSTPSDFSIEDGEQSSVDLTANNQNNVLGAGWYNIGTVGSFTGNILNVIFAPESYYNFNVDAVCLLQQTSKTVYDLAGNVASTIDALGHVALFTYDAQGRQTAVQQGAIIDDGDIGFTGEGGTWTTYTDSTAYKDHYSRSNDTSYATWAYDNLAPSDGGNYDIYVSRNPGSGTQYEILDENDDPLTYLPDISAAPSLGDYWYKLGSLQNYAGKKLTVKLTDASAYDADAVCLVQTMSKTIYDATGQTTAAIDPLGRVSVPVYDSLGRQTAVQPGVIADDGDATFATSGTWTSTVDDSAYQGDYQSADSAGSTVTWTFSHLYPNRQYAVNLSWGRRRKQHGRCRLHRHRRYARFRHVAKYRSNFHARASEPGDRLAAACHLCRRDDGHHYGHAKLRCHRSRRRRRRLRRGT